MSIVVTCPKCQARLNVKDQYAGQQGTCPKCKSPIQIPAAAPGAGSAGRTPAATAAAGQSPAAGSPVDPSAATVGSGRGTAETVAAEMISFRCEHCGRALRAGRQYAGRSTKCTGCGQTLTIPAAPAAAAAAVAAAPDTSTRSASSVAGAAAKDTGAVRAAAAASGATSGTAPAGAKAAPRTDVDSSFGSLVPELGGDFDLLSELEQGASNAPGALAGGSGEGGYGVDLGALESSATPVPKTNAPKSKKPVASLKPARGGKRSSGLESPAVSAAIFVGPLLLLVLALVVPSLLLPVNVLATIGILAAYVLVLVKMFQNGRTGTAIVSLVLIWCVGSLVAFAHGWLNVRNWRLRPVMLAWTSCWIVGVVTSGVLNYQRVMAEFEAASADMQPAAGGPLAPGPAVPVERPGPAAPRPAPQPAAPADSIYEEMLALALEGPPGGRTPADLYETARQECEALVALLEPVADAEGASQAAPAIADAMLANFRTNLQINAVLAGAPERAADVPPAVQQAYQQAQSRYNAALTRVQQIAGASAAFNQHLQNRGVELQQVAAEMVEIAGIAQFITQHGPRSIVVLRLSSGSDQTEWRSLFGPIEALADNQAGQLLARGAGARSTMMLAPVADPEQFAARIELGQVTAIDARRRIIDLALDTAAPSVPKPGDMAPQKPARPAPRPDGRPDPSATLLADLESDDMQVVQRAVRIAEQTEPDDRREKVLALLVPLFENGPEGIRVQVARALGKWGTAATAEMLAGAMSDPNRRDIQQAAGEGLLVMGSTGERAVLGLLSHPDSETRKSVMRLLGEIGTIESRGPLQRAAKNERNPPVAQTAGRALNRLETRLQREAAADPAAAAALAERLKADAAASTPADEPMPDEPAAGTPPAPTAPGDTAPREPDVPLVEVGELGWEPHASLVERLDEEIEFAGYRFRPPLRSQQHGSSLLSGQEASVQLGIWSMPPGGPRAPNIVVSIGPPTLSEDRPPDFAALVEQGLATTRTQLERFELGAIDEGQLAGLPAARVRYTGISRDGAEVRGGFYVVIDGQRPITLHGYAYAPQAQRTMPLLETAILSFAK